MKYEKTTYFLQINSDIINSLLVTKQYFTDIERYFNENPTGKCV
ncbi:MAG: hypothetical protein PHF63_02450 [Herbinix sp.]|nr:hypothetical protein [Herbinix sp.]